MRKFNRVMQSGFSAFMFTGLLFCISVNEEGQHWFTILSISLLTMVIGFLGAIYFQNPAKARQKVFNVLYISFAVVYVFFRSIGEVIGMARQYHRKGNSYWKFVKLAIRAAREGE